ncbi:leucine-rich repeat domain-containing protein [uncultured Microscilla sp.]|uniref:leucine-rich repeat domain-containing protein n=1 Tax=uncultured Microscilla sp. TaxID=432653 RepID=UPI0026360D16|nr:leucine-rich repeat domain-containing protein [uncultured Microscilla sp.]
MTKQQFYNLEQALKNPLQVTELILRYQKDLPLEEIAQLKNLEVLHLHHHPFKNLPENLQSLSKLHTLSLMHTRSAKVPEFIFDITSLQSLNLSYNPISRLPHNAQNLVHLRELLLHNCKLKAFPANIHKLEQLETLNLENNQIEQVPVSIGQLSKLQSLILTNNNIQGLPSEFALLNVSKLHLGSNPFYNNLGQKQKTIGALLKQFQHRNYTEKQRKLYFQIFMGVTDEAEKLASYEELLEGLNSPNQVIRLNTLSYLLEKAPNPFINPNPQQMHIHLAGKFNGFDTKELEEQLQNTNIVIDERLKKSTTHLVVGENPKKKLNKALEMGIPIVAQGRLKDFLHTIEDHYLAKNDAATLQMAKNLADLLQSHEENNQELGLEMAMGGGIHPSFFYDLLLLYLWNRNLKIKNQTEKVLEKHLSSNLFIHLKTNAKNYYNDPSEDAISTYLENICAHPDIDANELGIRFFQITNRGKRFCLRYPKSFVEVCQQEVKGSVLRLTGLKLDLLSDSIGKYTHLKILYLHNNSLSTLPGEFTQLQKLYVLSLKKNKFQEFPLQLLALPELDNLDLSSNKIEKLPDNIGKLTKLKRLNLRNNKLSQLPESIAVLKQLKTLNLEGNPIKKDEKAKSQAQALLPGCEIRF